MIVKMIVNVAAARRLPVAHVRADLVEAHLMALAIVALGGAGNSKLMRFAEGVDRQQRLRPDADANWISPRQCHDHRRLVRAARPLGPLRFPRPLAPKKPPPSATAESGGKSREETPHDEAPFRPDRPEDDGRILFDRDFRHRLERAELKRL
jgi:hypothetical protein